MGNRNLAIILTCSLLISIYANLAFGSMKLKEEANLTGSTLKELIGNSKELSGLTGVSLKNYEISSAMDESTLESFAKGYIERFTDEGWQLVLKGMNKGKTIIIFSMEKDGIRESLMVVVISSTELTEMMLTGKIELSSLDELRDAILKSIPKIEAFKSLEELLREESSPSQNMGSVMERWIALINEYGDKAPPIVFFELARTYEEMQVYDRALELYNTLINKEETPWMILADSIFRAGICSELLGKFDEANRYYEMIINKFGEKNNFESDYVAASESALMRLKNWKDEPLSTRALIQKADNIYYNKRDYNDAIGAYKVIIDNMPNSQYAPYAMLMTGLAYGHLRNPEKQIEIFEKMVKAYPSTMNHTYLGMAYQEAGRWADALEQYNAVIKDQEGASQWQIITAYYNAGICAQKLGMTDEAKKYYMVLAHKYESIDSAVVGDAERELLKIEKGGALPFLGLGFRYTAARGAHIVTVFKNGPSKSAGVQRGDVLLAIDSDETPDPNVAARLIAKRNIGDTVKLKIKRGDQTLEIPVTLSATPEKLER